MKPMGKLTREEIMDIYYRKIRAGYGVAGLHVWLKDMLRAAGLEEVNQCFTTLAGK